MDYSNIPKELKVLPQWVCTWENSKVPMQCGKRRGASSSNPETWSSYAYAIAAVTLGYYDHIGFVFADNGLVGIDIDCGYEDGLMTKVCADIINHANSYTEKSKSGRGVHIFLRGTLPFDGKNNQNGVEIYKSKRYFICTGKVILGYKNIESNQEGIDYVLNKYFSSNLDKVSGQETLYGKREGGKFERKDKGTKIYTPEWKNPVKGRFTLNPKYPEIKEGSRNISMLSLAGQLWNNGYKIRDIYKKLCEVNQQQCKPPLKESELERICNSISKYER